MRLIVRSWGAPPLTLLLSLLLLHFLAFSAEQVDLLVPPDFKPWQFLVLPSHKLMMSRIHKAGPTGLNHIAVALEPPLFPQHPDWTMHAASDHGLTAYDLSNILRDPSWYKAFIYREPLERFLSAYRSKCEGFDSMEGCERAFHHKIPSFGGAIRRLVLRENYLENDHFEPQAGYCNLPQTLPHFNESFILNPATSAKSMRTMLSNAHIKISDELNDLLNIYFAPEGTEGDVGHNTLSSNVSSLLMYYNHDCYIRLMVHFYEEDYSLLNIPIPDWAVGALERVTADECMEMIARQ